MNDGIATAPNRATYGGCSVIAYGLLGASQPTPSWTSEMRRRNAPGVAGAVTASCTSRCCVGATPAPIGVRAPSHTTGAPDGSYQW